MKTLRARYRIVTPFFAGGADPKKFGGIRPPSIKGALRFWWRALQWQTHFDRAGQNPVAALRSLHAAESRLFGTSADQGAQAKFLLSVEETGLSPNSLPKPGPGNIYLLGQGLYNHQKGYTWEGRAGGSFTLHLLLHPSVTDEERRSLEEALLVFGLLGGIGSRARHGLGSVAIQEIACEGAQPFFTVPQTLDALRAALAPLVQRKAPLPPFTAFSRETRIDVSLTGNDPWTLHDQIGKEEMRYRSYGRNGKVLDAPSERNFRDDHDLILNFFRSGKADKSPRRIVFGLPHNYTFSSLGKPNKVNVIPGEHERRASPLFLHLHPIEDKRFAAIHALLPATFLPAEEGIRLEAEEGIRLEAGEQVTVPARVDWKILHTFLDRFPNRITVHG